MLIHRPAHERGHVDRGWLDSRFSFSFAEYQDPRHMGFRSLRVLNDDIIQPGTGFGTHPHRDMEIISYIHQGRIEHRDSTGGASTIGPGEIQVMHAGSGIEHSEHAATGVGPTRMLQIWIIPDTSGVAPGYEQRRFPFREQRDRWHRVVAPIDRADDDAIGTGADDAFGVLAGLDAEADGLRDRHHWLQVVDGEVTLDHLRLRAGDGLAISDRDALEGHSDQGAELLLFSLG